MHLADRLHCLLRLLVLCACFVAPCVASADDLSDFEAARAAYDAQDHPRAVQAFEALVGTSPPRLTDRLLVLESRKYLGASLLFVNQEAQARDQFRLLILAEPDYVLDPLAFPSDVLSVFEQVKAEVKADLQRAAEAERKRLAAQTERALEAERRRQENLARLLRIAATEQVNEKNSRWVASVPFGVGQFQNGQSGLGAALAVSEGLAAASSVASFFLHERLRDKKPSQQDLSDVRGDERLWRTVNIASFSVFAGLALIGIIDAHVRFVPERVKSRPRPLPRDLEDWVRDQSTAAPTPGPRR